MKNRLLDLRRKLAIITVVFSTGLMLGNNAMAQCTPAPTSVDGQGITNVACGNINNTTGTETNNYGIYTAQSTDVFQGATVYCDITYRTGYTYNTKIWIDWNNDGDFDDAGENVYTGESLAANPTTLNASFVVPGAATLGSHVMRIGGIDGGTLIPCYTSSYGSFEDYTINVLAPVACSGTPSGSTAIASVSSVCSGSTSNLSVIYTEASTGLTFQWQSSPTNSNPWTNIVGATSSTYTATVTSDLYYRRIVTCTNSGLKDTSTTVLVGIISTVNDNCAGAITLTVNPTQACTSVTHGTTSCATSSGETNSCNVPAGGPNDDVWFKFTATSTQHIISMSSYSSQIYFGLFSGACGSLVRIGGCYDAYNVYTALTIGATYYIQVYTTSTSAAVRTEFDICVSAWPPPPANDNICNAILLPASAVNTCNPVSGTVAGATQSATANACGLTAAGTGYYIDDVWFTFVAQGPTHVISFSNIVGSFSTMSFVLYSGTCAAPTHVACYPSTNYQTISGLTTGTTYFIRAFTATNNANQNTSFNICTYPVSCASNDECTSAIPLSINPLGSCATVTSGTVNCATASAQANLCTSGSDDDDVWFSFVPTETSINITLQNIMGSNTDMYFSVYEGPCASPTQILCSDANSSTVGGLTIGNTYYLRVYTYTGTAGQTTTFDVCLSETLQAGMCDDAKPFCSDTTYNFPTNVGTYAAAGIDYGCLCTQPNPVWYYLKIAVAGPLDIEVESSCGDVDYAAWGPYSSIACDNLSTSGTYDYGSYTDNICHVDNFESPSGQMVDCAYSTASIETLSIPSAVVGEYYIVMINNFAECNGVYTFYQSGGTGRTDCAVLLPVGLLNFKSSCISDYEIGLSWTTITETNNDYFEVQKMVNGVFETIAVVDGHGSSNSSIEYNFVDYAPADEIHYYRLNQVDFDGSKMELKTIISDCSGQGTFDLNSAVLDATSGNLEIVYTGIANQLYSVSLTDLSGKVVFSDSFNSSVDGSNAAVSYFQPLRQGLYLVSLTNEQGITKFKKVVPR